MHRNNRFAFISIFLFVLDFGCLLLAFLTAYIIASNYSNLLDMVNYIWIILVFVPIFIFSMNSCHMYNVTTFNYYDRIIRNILFSTLVAGVISAATMFYIKNGTYSRLLYCIFIIVSFILLAFQRVVYVKFTKGTISKHSKNVIIVGSSKVANRFIFYMKKTNIKPNIIGYISIDNETPLRKYRCLGNISQFQSILLNNIVDEVIFTLSNNYINEFEKYALLCEEMGITSRVVLNLYNMQISKTHLSSIGPLPMITYHSVALNRWKLFLKRMVDIIGASIGIAVSIIPSVFIAIAIKLNSPGPVLFSQKRVGLNGRIFKIYKFRSMYINAEEQKDALMKYNEMGTSGVIFKIKHDPRITKIGAFLRKTSLDELPQFINVLKGDMSLVGTRPPTVDEVDRYELRHHRRISIKPGLTGLWQVSGRSKITNFDKIVSLDTKYIDEWSFFLDFKLIIKTILIVFTRKGAM